jgi:hypothetical protein
MRLTAESEAVILQSVSLPPACSVMYEQNQA